LRLPEIIDSLTSEAVSVDRAINEIAQRGSAALAGVAATSVLLAVLNERRSASAVGIVERRDARLTPRYRSRLVALLSRQAIGIAVAATRDRGRGPTPSIGDVASVVGAAIPIVAGYHLVLATQVRVAADRQIAGVPHALELGVLAPGFRITRVYRADVLIIAGHRGSAALSIRICAAFADDTGISGWRAFDLGVSALTIDLAASARLA